MTEQVQEEAKEELIERESDIEPSASSVSSQPEMTITQSFYQGPLPPPNDLKAYDEIEKGLASRIVAMAEKSQAATIENGKKILSLQGRDSLLGAIFSFLIVIVALFLGTFLIINNKDAVGLATILTGIGVIIKLFISKGKASDSDTDN